MSAQSMGQWVELVLGQTLAPWLSSRSWRRDRRAWREIRLGEEGGGGCLGNWYLWLEKNTGQFVTLFRVSDCDEFCGH